MTKTIQGALMPPETIQCQHCNSTITFGIVSCPTCGTGIGYERSYPLQEIIWGCITFFAFPLLFVAMIFPELGHMFGWPIVISALLALGGILAKWGFNCMWPKRNEIKPRFYRRTHLGYSTKTLDDEYAESMKPLALVFIVPFAVANTFVSIRLAHFVLGLFDADTGTLAFRIGFVISILMILGSAMLAVRMGLPNKLRSKKRFFA
jgi:hypothetical protein